MHYVSLTRKMVQEGVWLHILRNPFKKKKIIRGLVPKRVAPKVASDLRPKSL